MKVDRQKVYDKYNGRCAYCGCEMKIKDMQVDHCLSQYNFATHIKNNWRIPEFLQHLTIDDVNHIDNLMPSCRSCNNYKSTYNLQLFREEIQAQSERLYKNQPMVRLAERFGILTLTKKEVIFHFETVENAL